jgi:hypothetical protein
MRYGKLIAMALGFPGLFPFFRSERDPPFMESILIIE